MKDLYIIGAGGFGREVAWLAERINLRSPEWNIKGFIDDNDSLWSAEFDGYKVLGGIGYLKECDEAYVVCAVGSAKTRKTIIDKMADFNINYATLIDPSVILSNKVTIGEGSIICAGSVITVDITIGRHVIINLDCTIGHDSVLNDFVTLYPSVNVSGNVNTGHCVELGTGTQIIQGINIGDNAILGAGSVVTRNIPDNCTAVGVPAKPIKFNK